MQFSFLQGVNCPTPGIRNKHFSSASVYRVQEYPTSQEMFAPPPSTLIKNTSAYALAQIVSPNNSLLAIARNAKHSLRRHHNINLKKSKSESWPLAIYCPNIARAQVQIQNCVFT